MFRVASYLSDSARARQGGRRRLFCIYGLGVLGLLLIGVVWVVRYAPFFDVKSFVVRGNVRVASDAALDAVRGGVFQSATRRFIGVERLFAWPDLEERNLALLPAVSRIAVSKSYARRTVYVDVSERMPVGVWCLLASGCWWFDAEGVLFTRALDGEGGLLKTVHDYSGRPLGLGSEALPPALMKNLLGIFGALRESGAVPGEVRLDDLSNEEIQVATLNGPLLYFSLRFPLGGAADAVRQIFLDSGQFPPPQKLQYVDFRVENRVYYK